MSITVTELKNNLAKYLKLSQTEDVYITNHGKVIAKLCSPLNNRKEQINTLLDNLSQDKVMVEERNAGNY